MLQVRTENRFPFPITNIDIPSVETNEDRFENALELLDNLNGFELKRIKELFDQKYLEVCQKDANYQVHDFKDDYLYIIYYPDGNRSISANGAEAYEKYLKDGIRLDRKTKDLFPVYETLLEKEYVKPVRTNQKTRKQIQKIEKSKYDMDYAKDNIKQVKFTLNKNTDADIIEHLDRVENKQGYIKNLIRADIKKD